MIDYEELKKLVAIKSLDYINDDIVLGVGTGSTIKYFIEALHTKRQFIKNIVSSSKQTSNLLLSKGFKVSELSYVSEIDIYIDGADEVSNLKQMIKGGGGALTEEKILATASKKFICIVDESKYVNKLGKYPVAVEVIPSARSLVARELVKLGGMPRLRENYTTDHGNLILDVYNFNIEKPIELEHKIDLIVGVVSNGIFASRSADIVLIATKEQSIETLA